MGRMKTLAASAHLVLSSAASRHSCKHWSRIDCLLCTARLTLVQEITKKVKSYGKLYVDLPWSVEIKPTDPHLYPDMDTLIVKIFPTAPNEVDVEQLLAIDAKDEVCSIKAKNPGNFCISGYQRCVIEAPVQYNIDARVSSDSSASVFGMVSDTISMETEGGKLTGSKLQGKKIRLTSSQGGSVHLLGSVQGNIEIRTAKMGSIKAEKCLGTILEMRTEDGDVNLGSNYCEKALFSTVNGNLKLNNLHMDATVDIKGNGSLDISCLDGSLQANLGQGDAKIQVVRLMGESNIISAGPIELIVPKENNVRMNLRSNKMRIDDALTGTCNSSGEGDVYVSPGEIPLNVETSGDLRVIGLSWAESFQLEKFPK